MAVDALILFIFNTALTLIEKGDELWKSAKRKGELTPEQDANLKAKRDSVASKWAAKEAALAGTTPPPEPA